MLGHLVGPTVEYMTAFATTLAGARSPIDSRSHNNTLDK